MTWVGVLRVGTRMASRLRGACNRRLSLGHVTAFSVEVKLISESRHVRDLVMVAERRAPEPRFDLGVTVSTFKFDVNPTTWYFRGSCAPCAEYWGFQATKHKF